MSRCRACDEARGDGHWGPCANVEAAFPQPPPRPLTPEEQREWEEVCNDTRTLDELARDLGITFIKVK